MTEGTSQVTQQEEGTGGRFPRSLRNIMAVVMLGALMMQLDMTMTNIATRTLVRDFGAPLTTIQWVGTGYLLPAGFGTTFWWVLAFAAAMLIPVLFLPGPAGRREALRRDMSAVSGVITPETADIYPARGRRARRRLTVRAVELPDVVG